MKHVANNGFGDGLQRCMDQKYDMHAEIWRSDYSDAAWQNALFPPSGHGNCRLVGVNGIINYNSWFADTASIRARVASTAPGAQPMALDFWRAYTTDAAVAGLPRFDWNATKTLQMVDWVYAYIDTNVAGTNHWMNRTSGEVWFVPPICQDPSVTCGIAYAIAPFFNPGLPQQMVHNLGWKVVIQFWDTFGVFYSVAGARRDAGLQSLIMDGSLDPFVLARGEWTRVSLPPVSTECLVGDATMHINGVGSHSCDFPQQTLFKTSGINHDTDRSDAFSLFNRLSFSHESIANMLAEYAAGNSTMDVACEWVRGNSAVWSTCQWTTHACTAHCCPNAQECLLIASLVPHCVALCRDHRDHSSQAHRGGGRLVQVDHLCIRGSVRCILDCGTCVLVWTSRAPDCATQQPHLLPADLAGRRPVLRGFAGWHST